MSVLAQHVQRPITRKLVVRPGRSAGEAPGGCVSAERARIGRTVEALDTSPSRYIARVDRVTGAERPGPIHPDELLVHAHRDKHPVDITVQILASRIVELTGSEWMAKEGMRRLNRLGGGLAAAVGALWHDPSLERRARRLLGVASRDFFFRFREASPLPADEVRARVAALRREAGTALAALGPKPQLHVLLTGATGFLGKEFLVQAAADPHLAEVVCLLRPERGRNPRTGRVVKLAGARERGARLLHRLGIQGTAARRIRFVEGDVERPRLGLRTAEIVRLHRTLTHVVHCAASVAFDDSYESSFRANVIGSKNALAFSLDLQRAEGSPFVAHVAVETSYIHGRLRHGVAREDRLSFPAHFYNNFYELTKAMAALETERVMLEHGLRVAQILPSIVIGDARTGNNRGDTKVVNAPVNALGRIKRALEAVPSSVWRERLRASLVSLLGTRLPGDPSAELNLVTVDRVAAGVLAALTEPQAIGARIHLATDHRIRSGQMARVMGEELEIDLRLADPTLTRTLTLPLVRAFLGVLGEPRLAQALERLGALFGTYVEWGQPIHDVGDDVKILALPARRPDTVEAFRMLCRHSRFVQEFGTVRNPDEIARRERLWERTIDEIEFGTGRRAASLPAGEFRLLLEARVDLVGFRERRAWRDVG
jgi:nucleoside-diphosphate-sugar epimerase